MLLVWEVIPTYLIVFFFRVRLPSSDSVSVRMWEMFLFVKCLCVCESQLHGVVFQKGGRLLRGENRGEKPGIEPRASLPLSYDNQTTTSPQNPLYVLHRWYWMHTEVEGGWKFESWGCKTEYNLCPRPKPVPVRIMFRLVVCMTICWFKSKSSEPEPLQIWFSPVQSEPETEAKVKYSALCSQSSNLMLKLGLGMGLE